VEGEREVWEQLYRRKATSPTIRSVNSLGDGSKSGRTRRHRMSTMTTQTVYTGACSHERLSKRDRRETVTTLAPFASRIINFGAPTMRPPSPLAQFSFCGEISSSTLKLIVYNERCGYWSCDVIEGWELKFAPSEGACEAFKARFHVFPIFFFLSPIDHVLVSISSSRSIMQIKIEKFILKFSPLRSHMKLLRPISMFSRFSSSSLRLIMSSSQFLAPG